MIDYNHLPNIDQNISIFTTAGSTAWQTWQKPRGCKFVYIFVLGSGGGGGGGQSGTGVGRTGGGGGGSSGVNKGMFLSNTLPDTLYVNVGVGGTAGNPNGDGGNGAFSYVSAEPNTTAINVVLVSNSTTVPIGGLAASTPGNTGGVVANANQILNYCGVSQFSTGQIGTAGGANVGGLASSVSMSNIVTGGAGGGGSSSVNLNGGGGSVILGNALPTITGGVAGGTNNGQNGYCGIEPNKTNILRDAFVFTSGAGGGANGAGIGGNGGNGSYGCGGGGGGAGTTGGSGGRGGDGLVIIISY
jgi:hypothetical protein